MNTLRWSAVAAGVVALLGLGGPVGDAKAQDGSSSVRLSVLGGVQALNKNDTALPDQFINIPATAALSYDFHPNWSVEGEFAWMIPVTREVDLGGAAGVQERKSPDIVAYQASILGKLPVAGTAWTPYVAAGAGAVTFLSSTEADRFPQLPESQTAFAINFGAGTHYDIAPNWGLRADIRALAAFPADDAAGLSSGAKADPIWMERGTVGLSYKF